MYTEYLSIQQDEILREAPSRQAPPARRAAPRRRDPRRDRMRRMILALAALVLFLAGFISGCCMGRGRGAARDAGIENGAGDLGGISVKQQQKSNIPAKITLPDYVKEDLLPVNQYSRCGDKLQRVNAVVIHYVGNPNTTAKQNRSYFENLATTRDTSASSNLIVGLEGEALLCVPLDEVAYCSNDRNYDTVSIEFCHPDAEGKPNQATYDTLVKLTAWLCDLYGLDAQEGIIRHYDVTGKQCPMYFVQNEAEWTQFKADVAKAMT